MRSRDAPLDPTAQTPRGRNSGGGRAGGAEPEPDARSARGSRAGVMMPASVRTIQPPGEGAGESFFRSRWVEPPSGVEQLDPATIPAGGPEDEEDVGREDPGGAAAPAPSSPSSRRRTQNTERHRGTQRDAARSRDTDRQNGTLQIHTRACRHT